MQGSHPKFTMGFLSRELFGLEGHIQPFLCLGAGAAGAPYLAMTVSISARGFLGRSGRGSTATPSSCASQRENAAPVITTFSA